MGLFKKLRGIYNNRNWDTLATNISEGLKSVRNNYFDYCVKIIQENKDPTDNSSPDVAVCNNILGGEAELAIKAYQLYLVSGFLAQHSYIPLEKGKDFADILYNKVCGEQLKICIDYVMRYAEAENDGASQLFRFTHDVAKYITGKKTALEESMSIANLFPIFTLNNHTVVASCFGDNKTLSQLELICKNKLSKFRSK